MRQKMAIFRRGNSVCSGPNLFRNGEIIGGDASENGDFQRRKQRLQGTKGFQEPTLAGVVDEYMKFSGGDLVENRSAKI